MIGLKTIDKPKGVNAAQHELILVFLANLIPINSGIKKVNNIFDYDRENKVLDKSLGKRIDKIPHTTVTLKTKAMAEYLAGKNVTIKLIGEGKFNKSKKAVRLEEGFITKHYLYPYFKDKTTVSDNILYMWFDILDAVNIQILGPKEINMYFRKKPMDMFSYHLPFSFEYYLKYDRDKLLEREIELGYTNKIVGDKNRGYGYTHLFRANLGDSMIMPSSAIRLIEGWSKYNTYLTSRKQGKTSLAADRIVAELLSEKEGYGMRKTRRIKFFTDNASKIGKEVIEYIKDFLGDLKDTEIKKGVKMFNIDENNQEIVCNLTGHKFNVVSLKGLSGNSDNSTGDGLACDCGIIDEGFRIIERFWKSFKDRAFEECEWILFISTLNEETEITHWGYNELIKGEAGHDPLYNTVRSSDFDNSITYYNNFERKGKSLNAFYDYTWSKLREKRDDTSESYIMKRMLCGIETEGILFDISGRLTATLGNPKETDLRIISVDTGGKSDGLGICIFNARTLIVEKGYSLPIKDYSEIPELVDQIQTEYPNNYTVGDRGGPVGEAYFLLVKDKGQVDYWIKNVDSKYAMDEKEDHYTINKGLLVLTGSHALTNICKVYTGCKDLIEQFSYMEGKKSKRSSTILYKAKAGKNDDAVFAYLGVFGLLSILFGLKSKADIEEYGRIESSFQANDMNYQNEIESTEEEYYSNYIY